MHNLLPFTTTLLTTLSAGLFFAYACSVNPGLHLLSDEAYLTAMQHINRVIQNPAFFVVFMGPVVLLPWVCWMQKAQPSFYWWVAAAVLYIVGVFGITMFGNVPLNNMLEQFDISRATAQDMTVMRQKFEGPWGTWHWVRTVASILAAGSAVRAIAVL